MPGHCQFCCYYCITWPILTERVDILESLCVCVCREEEGMEGTRAVEGDARYLFSIWAPGLVGSPSRERSDLEAEGTLCVGDFQSLA